MAQEDSQDHGRSQVTGDAEDRPGRRCDRRHRPPEGRQFQLACSGLPSAYPAALWMPTIAFSANSSSEPAPA